MSHRHIPARSRRTIVGLLIAIIVAIPAASCRMDAPPALPSASSFVSAATIHVAPQTDTGVANDNTDNEDSTLHFVGKLPRPMTYYLTHGQELNALLSAKPWHGHFRQRSCSGCTAGEWTTMKIQAISNTHHDPLTGLPRNGVVVGRMSNVGNRTDLGTLIEPDSWFVHNEYYFIITDEQEATRAKLFVAQIRRTLFFGVQNNVRIVRAQNEYMKCPNHVEPPRTTSDGDFRNCPRGRPPFNKLPATGVPPRGPSDGAEAGSLFHLASLRSPLDAVPSLAFDGGPWFACDGGCCTAKWPPSADSVMAGF